MQRIRDIMAWPERSGLGGAGWFPAGSIVSQALPERKQASGACSPIVGRPVTGRVLPWRILAVKVRLPLLIGIWIGMLAIPALAQPAPRLISLQRIWDRAPHNAFTDLTRFQDRWYCVFREGAGHVSDDGSLCVISSADGAAWQLMTNLRSADSDLRDAKISVTPEGQLMLSGVAARHQGQDHRHQTLAWFSPDGHDWSPHHEIGEPDFWLWRITWHRRVAWGFAYGTRQENRGLRLYRSDDGKSFQTVAANAFPGGYPNETSLVFRDDGTCLCLLRRDGAESSAQLGSSQPPYDHWSWRDLGVRIGGPVMMELPDGRLLAVVRLYDGSTRTAICRTDLRTGQIREWLALPSAGDTSYAGMVWHEDRLWISYYSSHEGKASIYLAQVALPSLP
jgi:hypothetical protein